MVRRKKEGVLSGGNADVRSKKRGAVTGGVLRGQSMWFATARSRAETAVEDGREGERLIIPKEVGGAHPTG